MLGGYFSKVSDNTRWGKLCEIDISETTVVSGGKGYLLRDWLSVPQDEAILYTEGIDIPPLMLFDCANLRSIKLPSSAKTIGASAFGNCVALGSIVIPEGVEKLEEETFRDCRALQTVSLPSTVMEVGSYLIDGCASLQSFSCAAPTPPSCSEQSFYQVEGVTLLVPIGCSEAYQQHVGWSKFGTIEETDFLNGISSPTVFSVSKGQYPLYDLQGRSLRQAPQEGVYIHGGRKYVVR